MKIKYATACIILFLFFHGLGLSQEMLFDHYGPREGFNSTQALALIKGTDGFLWIGTERGLVRYDGHTFKTFNTEDNSDCNLEFDYVRYMCESQNGKIWLTSTNKLNIFDINTKKAIPVIFPIELKNNFHITSLDYDQKNDRIWVGTNSGLFYSQSNNIHLQKEFVTNINLSSGVGKIHVDENGSLWIINAYGINKYNPNSCITTKFPRNTSLAQIEVDEGFISSYKENDSIMWVGGWVNGLTKFNSKTGSMKTFIWNNSKQAQNGVYKIFKRSGDVDRLWLGTTDGVMTFDTNKEFFEKLFADNINDNFHIAGAGFSFAEAPEGLWIGTYKGLHRYDVNKNFIKTIQVNLSGKAGVEALPQVFFEKNNAQVDSIIWFSIENGEVLKYDLLNGQFIELPPILKKYCDASAKVYSIYIDSKNKLWLSTKKFGIVSYDINEKLMKIHEIINSNRGNPIVLNWKEDSRKKLWIGAYKSMYYYEQNKNESINLDFELENYLTNSAHSISSYIFDVNNDDELLIGGDKKSSGEFEAILYAPYKDKSQRYKVISNETLKNIKSVQMICFVSNKEAYITSFGPTIRLQILEDTVSTEYLLTSAGKRNSNFKSMLFDGEKQLILSTDLGVSICDLSNRSIAHHTFYNSNIGNTIQASLSFSPYYHGFYLSEEDNLNYIDLDKLPKIKSLTPIIADYTISNHHSTSYINSNDQLDLSYRQNDLSFEFTNLNYSNSIENVYLYKLNENEWKSCNKNKLTFNALSWGRYTLRVKSFNYLGVQSEGAFVLNFNISPPYYKSWWFNILILIFFALIVYTIFKYRDLQRLKLEKFRLSIARDLHDDMGSHLSHIKILSEMESMKPNTNPVFEKITHRLSEVMSGMSEIVWSINPTNDSINELAMKIQEFAYETLEPLNINVDFEIDVFNPKWKLSLEDRRNIYLIFKEAINNLAKYSNAKNATLAITEKDKSLHCMIADDGIGFDPGIINKGNGLKNMKHRAELLSAKFNIETHNNGTIIHMIIKL